MEHKFQCGKRESGEKVRNDGAQTTAEQWGWRQGPGSEWVLNTEGSDAVGGAWGTAAGRG